MDGKKRDALPALRPNRGALPRRAGKRHKQQSVQCPHCGPGTVLYEIGIVVEIDVFFGKRAFVMLVRKGPQGAGSKAGPGDEAPHPQLHEVEVVAPGLMRKSGKPRT